MCAHMIFELLTHNHSHDNINYHNDDKTVYVEDELNLTMILRICWRSL